MPRLQTGGQLTTFCREQLGASIPSPALFRPLHDQFVEAVHAYAEQHRIRVVRFARGQRKDEVAAWHRARFQASHGVVFIGIAQEKASAFRARRVVGAQGGVWFEFSRQPVAVNHIYFYMQDVAWGPAFVKVGTYLPYPVRVCLNGHEWAKQQLHQEGIAFTALDNGFRWCADPARLQQVCDALGPAEVQAFFDRWVAQLPWPLAAHTRAAGYGHRLSVWQVEVSLTQVFREPVWGRRCFEAIIRDNLDLGRPDRVSLVFGTKLTRATPPPPFGYRTRVLTRGVQPSLHVDFKHSHVKQYLKDGWALRTETTFNDPTDVQPTKALATLPHLREVGRQSNARLLETERLAAAAVPEPGVCARVQQPQVVAGQRVPALRLSDGRVLALLQALCQVAPRPDGFRHRELRPLVAGLLGRDLEHYSAGAMTYDLRRLRLHALIERQPHSFRYRLTPDGLHLAFGLSRIVLRLLQPDWAALLAPSSACPAPLRDALTRLDAALADLRQAA
ncbi:MAG: hypothetical protein JOZ93_15910 [Sinobacteraceae bacterium]|nr:hypothetical protein [Nevskiaceae bacterium]